MPQPVSTPSSRHDHGAAQADGQKCPATGVISSHPSLPPSLPPSVKQWSHSSYQESTDCLKCLPLCFTERCFFFPIDPEDSQREVGDNKMTLAGSVKPSSEAGTAFIWLLMTMALNCTQWESKEIFKNCKTPWTSQRTNNIWYLNLICIIIQRNSTLLKKMNYIFIK